MGLPDPRSATAVHYVVSTKYICWQPAPRLMYLRLRSPIMLTMNISEEHPRKLTTKRVISSNLRRKNTSLQNSERLINKLLINKSLKPSRNTLTEKCLGYLRHTFGLDKGQYPHEMSF